MTDDPASPPPVAEKRPAVFEAHGVRREDEYAWLKDVDDPGVLAYLRDERDHYDRVTAHLSPLRRALADEMVSRTPAADSSISWRRGARVYTTRTAEGEEYGSLYLIDSQTGANRALLDANALAAGGHLELGVVEPSPDGRWLAWSADRTGDEVYELRFRDIETGEDLPDVVPRTYYTGAWTTDSTAFLYTVPDEAHRPDRVRVHRLGTPASADLTVVEEPDRRFEVTVHASRDGAWAVVTAASRDTSEVHLVDAAAPARAPRLVARRRPGVEYAVEVLPGGWDGGGPDRLLIVTDDGEPEFRLLEADLPAPDTAPGDPARWRPVGGAGASRPGERLVAAHVFARHVVLELRRDGEPLLRVLDRTAAEPGPTRAREIRCSLPAGQVRLWRTDDPDATSVVIVEENLVTPPAWFEVDLATGSRAVRKRAEAPGVDLGRYVTERVVVPSTGGVSVPVTIARRRDLEPGSDAVCGCLLYAYGAYESCEWPEYAVGTLSLLDRGVVYAVAHVRGGGELGRGWWLDGRLRVKQHTCDDLLAARDALVAAGFAGPVGTARAAGRVVTRGLSAGGLLQGMAFSQAPDRWAGVVAEVPFVDVVTSMSDPSIPLTVNEWDEWGDPLGSAADFAAMLAYSPYDNPPAAPRPPLLVTGALHDPRVLVHEPAKWVARLRATERATEHATDGAARPDSLVFRVELGEGAHSGPTGRLALLHYEAEILAWVLERLDGGA